MTIVALLLCVCALVALVTVVLLVTSYAYFCINWRKVRHIPGPRPVWPIGNAGLLRVDGESITFLEAYDKLAKEYGDVFVFWMGCTPNVVTVSPELMRQIGDQFQQVPLRAKWSVLLSPSRERAVRHCLFFCDLELWSNLRVFISTFVSPGGLRKIQSTVRAASARLATTVQERAKAGGSFDMQVPLQTFALQVIFKLCYGVNMPGKDAGKSNLASAIDRCFELWGFSGPWNLLAAMFPACFRLWVQWLGHTIDRDTARKLDHSWDVLYAATRQIAETYARHHPEVDLHIDRSIKGVSTHLKPLPPDVQPSETCLVAKLLHTTTQQGSKRLEMPHLVGQAFSMLIVGYETVSSSIASIVYLLVAHPDKEAKLIEELRANEGVEPSPHTIEQWPYCMACISEGIRMYPIGPLVGRDTLSTATLGQYKIPAGTTVHLYYQYALRDPRRWDDADVFRPERFLTSYDTTAYLPFGVGPRGCGGQALALFECLSSIVTIFRLYQFQLCPDHHPGGKVEFMFSISQQVKHGLWLRARRRVW